MRSASGAGERGPADQPRVGSAARSPRSPFLMAVPFIDLTAQYESIRGEVDAAVARVVCSQRFILGPEVEALEEAVAERVGVRHAIGCASGTDALFLTLRALRPREGDEVILPAFTFFATAGAVSNAGFRPVFSDIDPVSFNVTRETIEAVWSARTRGVIPVHLFGQMAPMGEILGLARERGAFVVEDAAQAIDARQRAREDLGAPWLRAGSVGDAGAFSFFPTKNLGAFGDGGLITTSDAALALRLRKLRVHGGAEVYRHEMVGTNSRLDALQAAVLGAKLPNLTSWTRARRENADRYRRFLGGVEKVVLPAETDCNIHVYHQYTLRAERRDELRAHLERRQIGTAVYYPLPLHLQRCFSELGGRRGQLPVAERASCEVLSLPVFPELGEERQKEVSQAIREFYGT